MSSMLPCALGVGRRKDSCCILFCFLDRVIRVDPWSAMGSCKALYPGALTYVHSQISQEFMLMSADILTGSRRLSKITEDHRTVLNKLQRERKLCFSFWSNWHCVILMVLLTRLWSY